MYYCVEIWLTPLYFSQVTRRACNNQPILHCFLTLWVSISASPGKPTIDASKPNASITEGDNVTLKCSTSGGSPRPSITWRKNGLVVTGNIVESGPSVKYGATISRLSTIVARTDNGARFTCEAENSVNRGSPVSRDFIINVRCKYLHNYFYIIKKTVKILTHFKNFINFNLYFDFTYSLLLINYGIFFARIFFCLRAKVK